MMPFILVFIGLILIVFEFYLPGAIMGVMGSVFILIGVFLFAAQSQSVIATLFFIGATALALGLLIRLTLRRIVQAKPQYSIYSNDNQTGYFASSYDKTAIGKTGIVLTDLKPGGYILIEGQQHAAISLEGYISEGESVHVVSGQEQSLFVTLSNKESLS